MVTLARPIPQRGAAAADPLAALAARYPDWFALGTITPPPGWRALVERLFTELDAALTGPARAQFQVAAVGERDGRLQVATYVEPPAARALIDRTAAEAARICQSCGAPARRKAFTGWTATLCAACRRRWGAMTIGAR